MPVGVIPGFGGAPVGKSSGASSTMPNVAELISRLPPELRAMLLSHPATQTNSAGNNAAFNAGLQQGITGATTDNGKGVGFNAAPYDAKQLELSAGSILAQTGVQKHKSPGLFSRIVDIISRPMYSMASGAQRAGEDLGTKGFGLHTIEAYGKGGVEGISGRNKEDFGKLLQEKIDIDKVKKDHPDWNNTQVLKEVKRNPGQAQNRLLTGLGGLTEDIALDPTSAFTGFGKVVKVGEDAKNLAETERLANQAVKAGVVQHPAEAIAKLGARLDENGRIASQGTAGTGKFSKISDLISPAQKEATVAHAIPFMEELAKAQSKVKAPTMDLSKITDGGVRRIIEDTIKEHLAQYPFLAKSLRSVTSHDTLNHVIASNKAAGTLKINGGLSHIPFTNKVLSELNKVHNWTSVPVGTRSELARYITTHELGHHMEYLLKPSDRKILEDMAKDHLQGAGFADHISQYSNAKGGKEWLPEAWTAHKLAPGTKPLADSLGQRMEEMLSKAHPVEKNTQVKLNELNSVLQRNLNPEMRRALEIHFRGIPIAHIPVERLAQFATDFTHGDHIIGRGVQKWEELFRSGKGIPPLMNNIKLSSMGNAEDINRAMLEKLRPIYNGVPYATRKGVMDAYRRNIKSYPAVGKDGTNLLKHLHSTVQRIQESIETKQELIDFNRWLPRDWKIDPDILNARSIPKDWLEQTVKNTYATRRGVGGKLIKDMHDPGTITYMLDHAVIKSHARRSMWETIAHVFGHAAEHSALVGGKKAGPSKSTATKLKGENGKPYRTPTFKNSKGQNVPLPHLKGHVFHPDIADSLEKFHTILTSPKEYDNKITQMMAPATHAFKSLVTKWNPGFHERNLLGEIMASTMAGVHDPAVYKQAATVLHQWGRIAGEDAKSSRATQILTLNNPETKGAGMRLDGKTITLKKAYRLPNGELTKQLPVDLVMDLFRRNGLRTGWYGEFGNTLGHGGAIQKLGSGLNHGVQHGTELIEDFARMSHFIDALNKSTFASLEKAAEEAAITVRKYHFDYTDFTPFEKNVMANIFPFYKWTRKNIPMQIEMLLTHPGRVSTIPKVESALSRMMGFTNGQNSDTYLPGADAILPDFLRTNGAFPIGTAPSGNTRYLDPALPTVQGFTAMQPGNLPVGGFLGKVPIPGLDTAETMASPFLKIPAELATGRKLGGGLISDSNKYAAATTPYTNLLYSIMNKKPGDPGTSGGTFNNTKLIQFLAGIGLQENTPAYMQSQAKRDQQVASAKRKAYEKKHGTFHSTNHPGVK